MHSIGWMMFVMLMANEPPPAQEPTVEVREPLQAVAILDPEPVPQATPKPQPRKKPVPQLVCGPATGSRTQVGTVGLNGFRVHCRVRVMFPDERFWCPDVEWEIDGERYSAHSGDCDPFSDVVTDAGEPFLWFEPEKWLPPFGRGTHTITVKLMKNGKVIFSDYCEVQVS